MGENFSRSRLGLAKQGKTFLGLVSVSQKKRKLFLVSFSVLKNLETSLSSRSRSRRSWSRLTLVVQYLNDILLLTSIEAFMHTSSTKQNPKDVKGKPEFSYLPIIVIDGHLNISI